MSGHIFIFTALVFSGVINFLSISIYSRLLTPHEYGHYSVVISSLALAYCFMFFWLINSFTRFSASGKKTISKIQIGSFYNITLILCIACVMIIYLLSIFWIKLDISNQFWICIFCALNFEAFFNLFSVHVRFINNSPKIFFFAVIFRSILAIALGWYFVVLGYGYEGVIAAVALSFFICVLFLLFAGKIYTHISLCSFDRKFAVEVCAYGLPIVFILAIQSAINSTDRILLVNLEGAVTAGQYSASQDLVVKLLIFLIGILHRVLFPLVIKKMDTASLKEVKTQLQQNITFILLISVPAAFAICFYAENIVYVVLGEEFRVVSIKLMPYQVFIAMLNCLTMFYIVTPFYLLKNTRALIVPSLIALLANLGVGYFTIKEFGMYGAVLGSFIAYFLYFSVSLYFGRKSLKLPFPVHDTLKIVVSAGLMVAILSPLKSNYGVMPLVNLVICGVFSYMCAILILNVANIRKNLLDGIKRKKSAFNE